MAVGPSAVSFGCGCLCDSRGWQLAGATRALSDILRDRNRPLQKERRQGSRRQT